MAFTCKLSQSLPTLLAPLRVQLINIVRHSILPRAILINPPNNALNHLISRTSFAMTTKIHLDDHCLNIRTREPRVHTRDGEQSNRQTLISGCQSPQLTFTLLVCYYSIYTLRKHARTHYTQKRTYPRIQHTQACSYIEIYICTYKEVKRRSNEVFKILNGSTHSHREQ